MVKETEVQSQVESLQCLKKIILDDSLLLLSRLGP